MDFHSVSLRTNFFFIGGVFLILKVKNYCFGQKMLRIFFDKLGKNLPRVGFRSKQLLVKEKSLFIGGVFLKFNELDDSKNKENF